MMDFPAPVSPVKTVKPSSKLTVNSSIMAKFLMDQFSLTMTSPLYQIR